MARGAAFPASTCLLGSRPVPSIWRASAGTGRPPGWSCGPRTSMPFARPSPLTRPRCSAPRTCGGPSGSTRWSAGPSLGLDLAEELQQLAPFGMGNPGVRLLVPSARVRDVRTMGRRASTLASACTAAPTGRSGSPSAARSWGSGRTIRSTPRCGSRSTAGTARSSRGSCCASSIRARRGAPSRRRRGSGGSASRPSCAADPAAAGRRRASRSRPIRTREARRPGGGAAVAELAPAAVVLAELQLLAAARLAVLAVRRRIGARRLRALRRDAVDALRRWR